MIVMHAHDLVANASLGALHTPIDPQLMADYEQYYAAKNVWVDGISRMQIGKAGHPEDHLPHEDYVKSEFYNDWMRPLGNYGTASGIVLHRDADRFLILSGNVRLEEADSIRMPLAHLLDMLAPHISRSFEMMRHLPPDLLAQDYRATMELSAEPIYFIDRRGLLVHTNTLGNDLRLKRTVLHQQKDGRIELFDPRADVALSKALRAIAETKFQLLEGEFQVKGADGTQFSATVAPLRTRAGTEPAVFDQIFEDLPIAILLLRKSQVQTNTGGMAREFGLTATEVALAQAIANGRSPKEVADHRGVSINTVRTQLKSVYSKTGLHRQSQLAGLFHQI